MYKLEYYAVFLKDATDNQEGYAIFFPDFPGCVTCADSIADGIKMASESLGLWLHGKKPNELPLPRERKCLLCLIDLDISYDMLENGYIITNTKHDISNENRTTTFHAVALNYPNWKDIYVSGLNDFFISIGNIFDKSLDDVIRSEIIQFINGKRVSEILSPKQYCNYFSLHIITLNMEISKDGALCAPSVIEF